MLEDALTKSETHRNLHAVLIDMHEEEAKNPDYALSFDRVKKWEKDHGQIPASAFVAMRND